VDPGALLPGPALAPWLRHRARESTAVGVWLTPLGGGGWLGRGLIRLIDELGLEPADGRKPLDLLIVITSLADEDWPAAASSVVVGGQLVELAHPPPWRLRDLAALGRRRAHLRWAIERRARCWLRAGLFAVSQWSPVEPPGILVTAGRRRIGGLHVDDAAIDTAD
jgi:hypothetical protein